MATNSTSLPPAFPPFPKINLNPTLGADFIGVVVSSIFYGITTLQTIIYFSTYDKDRRFLKALVGSLWILDSASLALFAAGVYQYSVTNFGNPIALEEIDWSIASEPMVTGVIGLIVHLFLAFRIRNLNQASIWTYVAFAVAVASLFPFAVSIVTTWRVNTGGKFLTALTELHWMAIAGDVSTSVIDIFIAITLTYQLYQGKTALKSTQKAITTITIFVISSGFLTATINVATLISYLAAENKLVFQLFNACSSKAYVNTLMATLNMRQVVLRQVNPSVIGIGNTNFQSMVFRHTTTNTNSTPMTMEASGAGIPMSEEHELYKNERSI
ncbi:hypothetical protein FB45DRAFT_917874 [Roridomyces roridus]|uniref:DUF6534 domain-containing protein n=1 Tax=Roridomyces roridus TaxID=1738132 RepID=A0AAD7FLK9_9AGAR|nr:hypothetical protein FB45DRAFT_917874 [Roridomyces roridus]